jgi:hypothetical protein
MKKSILLNEDEKNRILNLHETAKNLYENKKPVSQIKESNSKKENMKKVIKLTESDLEKIVRRVIKESMGVGFGAEPNGFRIKKMETKEQQENQFKTFSPENVKKISDMANQLFNRGDKDAFFTIDTLPTYMFQLPSTNEQVLNLGNTPLIVWEGFSGVPLDVREIGELYIKNEQRGGISKLIHDFEASTSNAMSPIQKEPEAIMAAKNFGNAFGTVFPEDVTSKVLINTYKTMTGQNKNNLMAFLQRTNPELNTYKQKIKSTLGLA